MSGKAAKVKCTEKQIEILEHIIKSTRSEQRLIARAKIIWNAFHGKRNDEISKIAGLDRGQVGVWRRRWKMSFDALVAIECREPHAQLVRSIEEVLTDAPRSGRPPTFTPEQVTQILAVACEEPGSIRRRKIQSSSSRKSSWFAKPTWMRIACFSRKTPTQFALMKCQAFKPSNESASPNQPNPIDLYEWNTNTFDTVRRA